MTEEALATENVATPKGGKRQAAKSEGEPAPKTRKPYTKHNTVVLVYEDPLEEFDWNYYLEKEGAVAAPPENFYQKEPPENRFEVGMRLSIPDLSNQNMNQCLGEVTHVCKIWVRVLLLGTDNSYASYFIADDRSLKAIVPDDCVDRDVTKTVLQSELQIPGSFRKGHTMWKRFKEANLTNLAPVEIFNPLFREPRPTYYHNEFQVGQKLEAVDLKCFNGMMSVGTISAVDRDCVVVHFDGWPKKHDVKVPFDSRTLFPVGYAWKAKLIVAQVPDHENPKVSPNTRAQRQEAAPMITPMLEDVKDTLSLSDVLENGSDDVANFSGMQDLDFFGDKKEEPDDVPTSSTSSEMPIKRTVVVSRVTGLPSRKHIRPPNDKDKNVIKLLQKAVDDEVEASVQASVQASLKAYGNQPPRIVIPAGYRLRDDQPSTSSPKPHQQRIPMLTPRNYDARNPRFPVRKITPVVAHSPPLPPPPTVRCHVQQEVKMSAKRVKMLAAQARGPNYMKKTLPDAPVVVDKVSQILFKAGEDIRVLEEKHNYRGSYQRRHTEITPVNVPLDQIALVKDSVPLTEFEEIMQRMQEKNDVDLAHTLSVNIEDLIDRESPYGSEGSMIPDSTQEFVRVSVEPEEELQELKKPGFAIKESTASCYINKCCSIPSLRLEDVVELMPDYIRDKPVTHLYRVLMQYICDTVIDKEKLIDSMDVVQKSLSCVTVSLAEDTTVLVKLPLIKSRKDMWIQIGKNLCALGICPNFISPFLLTGEACPLCQGYIPKADRTRLERINIAHIKVEVDEERKEKLLENMTTEELEEFVKAHNLLAEKYIPLLNQQKISGKNIDEIQPNDLRIFCDLELAGCVAITSLGRKIRQITGEPFPERMAEDGPVSQNDNAA